MSTQSVDPRTGIAFGPVIPDTTSTQLREFCDDAAQAAQPWGDLLREERARMLRAVADALDAAGGDLIPLADSESALGLPRLTGELARTTFQIRTFADALDDGSYLGVIIDPADSRPVPVGHPDLRRMLVPLGPVAVYGASNFPFAFSVAGGDTASALAAGCPVVVKAHPAHPQLSDAVFECMRDALAAAGAPSGVISIVHGFIAGAELIVDPAIRAGAFTGSGRGGHALFTLAAGRTDPIPFYGELGSVNPVFVTSSAATRDSLAAEYLDSLLLGGGQFCSNPSVLVVPSDSGLLASIVEQVSARPDAVLLHEGVAHLFAATSTQLASIHGVRLAAGALGPAGTAGFTQSPLIFAVAAADVITDPSLLSIECFGPAGVVIEYASTDEAMAVARLVPGCLAATIHSDDTDPLAASLLPVLARRAGRVIWNGWPTGVAVTSAQQHGGPHPATTNSLHTSVGTTAMRRFLRPVAYQSFPQALLPTELRTTG